MFYDNVDFDSLAVLTPSSQSVDLPATNVQNDQRTRVWRTGPSATTSGDMFSLVVDFGSAVGAVEGVDAFIAHYTTLPTLVNGSPTDTNIRIQANATNSWGSPSFDQVVPLNSQWDSVNNLMGFKFASRQTFRYFRFIFTVPVAGVTRDIGRIFLGKIYDIVRPPLREGVDIQWSDGSNKFKTVGLNTFVERKQKFRVVTLNFPPMAQADVTQLDAIFKLVGEGSSIFIQVDQAVPYDEILYVKWINMYKKKLKIPQGTTPFWTVQLQFEEQL